LKEARKVEEIRSFWWEAKPKVVSLSLSLFQQPSQLPPLWKSPICHTKMGKTLDFASNFYFILLLLLLIHNEVLND
jgi:putative effector of murein hydrolase